MAKAFENIRVADFSQVLAGPFATQQLALLGAEVIKVEMRGTGDQARQMLASGELAEKRMAPLYLGVNALSHLHPQGYPQAFPSELMTRWRHIGITSASKHLAS